MLLARASFFYDVVIIKDKTWFTFLFGYSSLVSTELSKLQISKAQLPFILFIIKRLIVNQRANKILEGPLRTRKRKKVDIIFCYMNFISLHLQ